MADAASGAEGAGTVAPLVNLLVEATRTGVLQRFKRAVDGKTFAAQDVDAGREYVEAYVTFIHYVEGVYEAATRRVEGHYPERVEGSHHEE